MLLTSGSGCMDIISVWMHFLQVYDWVLKFESFVGKVPFVSSQPTDNGPGACVCVCCSIFQAIGHSNRLSPWIVWLRNFEGCTVSIFIFWTNSSSEPRTDIFILHDSFAVVLIYAGSVKCVAH